MNQIIVTREHLADNGLWGYLSILVSGSHKRVGYTLEPPLNIPQKGYIPDGVYDFEQWLSPRLGKTLRLHGVSNFSNVLVHVGNTAADTRGCILVGKGTDNSSKPSRLVSSRVVSNYLYDAFPKGKMKVHWNTGPG